MSAPVVAILAILLGTALAYGGYRIGLFIRDAVGGVADLDRELDAKSRAHNWPDAERED